MADSVVRTAMCGVPHHELGWGCERLRGHFGEHMSSDPWHDRGGTVPPRRVQWPTCGDEFHGSPAVKCILPPAHDAEHVYEDRDGKGVTWPQDTGKPDPRKPDAPYDLAADGWGDEPAKPELVPLLEASGDHGARYRNAYAATLLLLLWICCPAVIVAAYRWGF